MGKSQVSEKIKYKLNKVPSPRTAYPESFMVGDIVEGFFPDDGWYRGTIINVLSEDMGLYEILYDGEEGNPLTEEIDNFRSFYPYAVGEEVKIFIRDDNRFATGIIKVINADNTLTIDFSNHEGEISRISGVTFKEIHRPPDFFWDDEDF